MKKTSKKWVYTGVAVVVLAVLGAIVFGVKKNGHTETVSVERRDIREEVRIAGTVEADVVADLSFDVSGRVYAVSAKVGNTVRRGDVLISLDPGSLLAELASAEAEVLLARAETESDETNLEEVKKQQDTLVESAYRTMLSTGLSAEPASSDYDVTAPVISGLYTGPEGQYKIGISSDASNNNDYDIRTFNLERTGPVDIDETAPTMLGTHGLFISFPDDLAEYSDTSWYLNIPNVKHSSYTANYNAYQESVRTRDREVAEASSNLKSGGNITGNVTIRAAELAVAMAKVDQKRAGIAKYTLRAPFDGTVAKVEADLGETFPANTTALSLISPDLGVEIDLPEIDSTKVSASDSARVTFDAIPGREFVAHVATLNRVETIVDGVPVYEARLSFDEINKEKNDEIVSGMTAEVTITTDSRENVLALPARAVHREDDDGKDGKDGKSYVTLIDTDGEEVKREVVTGLRGSDGYVEIVSGLNEADKVAVSI